MSFPLRQKNMPTSKFFVRQKFNSLVITSVGIGELLVLSRGRCTSISSCRFLILGVCETKFFRSNEESTTLWFSFYFCISLLSLTAEASVSVFTPRLRVPTYLLNYSPEEDIIYLANVCSTLLPFIKFLAFNQLYVFLGRFE